MLKPKSCIKEGNILKQQQKDATHYHDQKHQNSTGGSIQFDFPYNGK